MKYKIKKSCCRIFSVVLLVAMLSISFQTGIIAIGNGASNTVAEENLGSITEVTERREENVKHFDMGDGTYKAVSYGNAVHRKDENGNWQDINNNLSLTTEKGKDLYTTDDTRATFAKQFAPNIQLVTLSENGYSVSMGIIQNISNESISSDDTVRYFETASSTVTNSPLRAESWNDIDSAAVVDNKSSIVYNNVKSGIDLEYILDGNDLKENIIVKSKQSSYVYDFQLTVSGLSAELNTDGSISLFDIKNGAEIYTIPAPYMYDANGNLSYEVAYTLTEIKTGAYILTVAADDGWINSTQRAFPITIDPSVFLNPTPDYEIWDTYTATNISSPQGNAEDLAVGGTSEKAYYRFTLPSVNGRQITQAQLKVTYYFPSNCSGQSINLELSRIGLDWSEDTLTAASATLPMYTYEDNTVTFSGYYASTTLTTYLDFTNLAKLWYSGQYQNYGFAIRRASGSISKMYFKSSEAIDRHRPYILVTYQEEFDDGVYMFKNVGAYNMYMDTRYPSDDSGSYMQQYVYDYGESPGTDFTRSGLFKIIKDGDNDRYIIRLMSNNALTFDITDDGIVTKEIPLDNSQVFSMDTFIITYNQTGYILQKSGSSRTVAAKNSYASGEDYGWSSLLTYETSSTVTDLSRWEIIKYEPEQETYGVSYKTSAPLEAGNNVTVTPIVYSTSPELDSITLNTTFMPQDAYESLTVGYNGRLTFTRLHCAESLYVEIYLGDTMTCIGGITLDVQLPFEEGNYLIKNSELNEYISAAPSENSAVTVQGLLGSGQQPWIIEHKSDGYYTLTLYDSDMCLTAPSATDIYLTMTEKISQTPNDRQLWKLDESSNSFYSKYYEENNYAPYVNANSTISYVRYDEYYSNYNYEWNFYKIEMADIELVSQEKSNWCWIACANMFAKYYSGIDELIDDTNLNLSQTTIANELMDVGELDNNYPGRSVDVCNAIDIYLNIETDSFAQFRFEHIFRESTLKEILDDGNVIIAGLSPYELKSNGKYEPQNNGDGHFLLVCGYVNVGVQTLFLIMDPWEPLIGSTYWLTYDELFWFNRLGDDNYKMWQDAIIINDNSNYEWTNYFSIKQEIGI